MTPHTRPITDRHAYRACVAGRSPAEVLDTGDRERLVAELHRLGWSDVEIAAHCRMTTYITGRIRDRLELAPNNPREGATT